MQPEQATTKNGTSARLGGARADFVAGLGRKVADLRNAFARVRTEPGSLSPREELRRKLHALGTAAKLMKCDAMERGIADAVGIIDRTAIDEPLAESDLASITQIIEDLPALAWGDGPARASGVQPTGGHGSACNASDANGSVSPGAGAVEGTVVGSTNVFPD